MNASDEAKVCIGIMSGRPSLVNIPRCDGVSRAARMGAYECASGAQAELAKGKAVMVRCLRAAEGEVDPQIGTGGAEARAAFTTTYKWVASPVKQRHIIKR